MYESNESSIINCVKFLNDTSNVIKLIIVFQAFMKSIKQFTVSRNAGENFAKGSISHSLFNVFCYKN